MPRSSQTERLGLLHGHDSLHDFQRTEDRDQRTDQTVHRADLRPKLAVPTTENLPEAGARAICPLISALCPLNLVGLGRLERPTSRLSGVRSNQLSYRPVQRTESRDQMTDQTQRREPSCPCRV
jgi:hypothetical protein